MGPKKGNRNDSSDDDDDYAVDEFGNPMPLVSTEGWESCKTIETKHRGPRNANTKKNNRERNTHMKPAKAKGRRNSTHSEEDQDEKQGGFESDAVELAARGRGQLPLLTSFEATSVSHTGARTDGKKTIRTVFAKESPEEIQQLKALVREPIPAYAEGHFGLGEGVAHGMPVCPNFQKVLVPIPERPPWREGITARELHAQEEAYFLAYLTGLYEKYGAERLNHFEHNLDVWRQLWRVCERSDIIVLVADARHPLLHFHRGVYEYLRAQNKPMVLLLNKVDTLPVATVHRWQDYFKKEYPHLHVVVFSSYPSTVHRFLLGDADKTTDALDAELAESLGGLDLAPADLSAHAKEVAKKKRAPRVDAMGVEALLVACRALAEAQAGTEVAEHVSFEASRLLTERDREKMRAKEEERRAELEALRARLAKEAEYRGSTGNADEYTAELEEEEEGDVECQADTRALALMREDAPVNVSGSTASQVALADADRPSWREGRKTKESLALLRGGVSDSEDDEDMDLSRKSKKKGKSRGKAKRTHAADAGAESEETAAPAVRRTLTIGTIGHPNAGKSSLVNALTGKKVVSVSRQPGHTKTFQTLLINESTVLCDCPGLVFPSVDVPRPLQVLSGIYPIPQTREPMAAVRMLAQCVPLDRVLGLPRRNDWSAYQLCEAYAEKRGFTFSHGRADVNRAAQAVLYAAVDGKIQFYFEPPSEDELN